MTRTVLIPVRRNGEITDIAFTEDDLRLLQKTVYEINHEWPEGHDVWNLIPLLKSLADRIAALLPPENPND